ncbi:MAG: MoxR family ATPase [Rhodothalassiaceae bacterium]
MDDRIAPGEDSGEDRIEATVAEAEQAAELCGRIKAEVARRIIGQDRVIEETLATLLAGGHALIVGVPGLAKTLLVDTLADVLGLSEKRVQFTPDLLPADILGSEVLEENASGERSFRFLPGPIFSQLLMADEINRASPRTQSALLQAMQEREVSVAGVRHALPAPFHVLATQNPIEQEGTYPLPEAQLDRFLMQIDVDYPDREAERAILISTTGIEETGVTRCLDGEGLIGLQRLVRRLPVGESVVEAILDLVRAARPSEERPEIVWGPGPRAAQALMLGVRARALIEGRLAPSVEDVTALAGPVLRHRMALAFSARADGMTNDMLIETLAARL